MKYWILFLSAISSFYAIAPVQAAEKVILKYSVLRESVAVSELSTLSQTGEASTSLQSYLDLVSKKPEDLRKILNYSIPVTPVALSKLLNSFAGKFLLNKVREVIHTPSEAASTEALKSALVTSANTNDEIHLIEVLENYPTSEIQVEGDRIMELYEQYKTLAANLSKLPF